jgi:hypothetical protein
LPACAARRFHYRRIFHLCNLYLMLPAGQVRSRDIKAPDVRQNSSSSLSPRERP